MAKLLPLRHRMAVRGGGGGAVRDFLILFSPCSMGVLNDHFHRLTSSKSILLTLHGGA